MAPWKRNVWVDDDGSLTVGTAFDAEHMNNIELGLVEVHDGVAAASGMAGSALANAASGVNAAGSALVTGQQANARAASGVAAAGSALVTGQFAGALRQQVTDLETFQQEEEEAPERLTLVRATTTAAFGGKEISPDTIEAPANGTFAPDGVALAVGDRVLLKNDTLLNGVYRVLSVGSASTKARLERIPQMRTAPQFTTGMQVVVAQGTKYAATTWEFTTTGAITLGLTTLTFVLVGKENPVNSTVEDLKVIRGIVSSAAPTIVKGTGFTIAKTATGRITIKFTVPFSDIPSVMFSNNDGGHLTPIVTTGGTASEAFAANLSTTFEAVDGVFGFLAIGPR